MCRAAIDSLIINHSDTLEEASYRIHLKMNKRISLFQSLNFDVASVSITWIRVYNLQITFKCVDTKWKQSFCSGHYLIIRLMAAIIQTKWHFRVIVRYSMEQLNARTAIKPCLTCWHHPYRFPGHPTKQPISILLPILPIETAFYRFVAINLLDPSQ